MRMFLDSELIKAAKEKARQMIEDGSEATILKTEDKEGRFVAEFRVQRSSEDLTVLGSVVVEGETFFIGVQSE